MPIVALPVGTGWKHPISGTAGSSFQEMCKTQWQVLRLGFFELSETCHIALACIGRYWSMTLRISPSIDPLPAYLVFIRLAHSCCGVIDTKTRGIGRFPPPDFVPPSYELRPTPLPSPPHQQSRWFRQATRSLKAVQQPISRASARSIALDSWLTLPEIGFPPIKASKAVRVGLWSLASSWFAAHSITRSLCASRVSVTLANTRCVSGSRAT